MVQSAGTQHGRPTDNRLPDPVREWFRIWASRLARPAPFGKDDTALVCRAAKRAGKFEGFITLGPRRHLARELQRVLSSLVPFHPIPIG